jgi:hypothetical protein
MADNEYLSASTDRTSWTIRTHFTLQRISNHANAAGSIFPESESLLFALWQAERQAHAPELQILFDGILSCFEAVNHALNTQDPSGTIEGKAEALPRSLDKHNQMIMLPGCSCAVPCGRTAQITNTTSR